MHVVFLLLLYLSVSPFTRSVIIPLSLFADLFPHRVVCVATITAHYVYVSRARPLQYLSPIDSDKFRSTIGIRRNAQIIPNMMIIENENFSFGWVDGWIRFDSGERQPETIRVTFHNGSEQRKYSFSRWNVLLKLLRVQVARCMKYSRCCRLFCVLSGAMHLYAILCMCAWSTLDEYCLFRLVFMWCVATCFDAIVIFKFFCFCYYCCCCCCSCIYISFQMMLHNKLHFYSVCYCWHLVEYYFSFL